MGLSTERKVFVAVLVVAGAALVIDRGILGPSEATASLDMPGAETLSPAGEVSIAPTKPASKADSMAKILMQRIEGIPSQSGDHSLSGAFSLEKFMKPVASDQEQAAGTSEGEQPKMLNIIAADVPEMPALTAVMPATNGGGAVLDGKLVRVGDSLAGGFTLVEVRERSVVLELNGVIYPLLMPMQNRP